MPPTGISNAIYRTVGTLTRGREVIRSHTRKVGYFLILWRILTTTANRRIVLRLSIRERDKTIDAILNLLTKLIEIVITFNIFLASIFIKSIL